MNNRTRTPLRTVFALLLSSLVLVGAPAVSHAAPVTPPLPRSNIHPIKLASRCAPRTNYDSPFIYAAYNSADRTFNHIIGCGFGVFVNQVVNVYSPSGALISQVTTTSDYNGSFEVTDFGIPPCQLFYTVQVSEPLYQVWSNREKITNIGCLT